MPEIDREKVRREFADAVNMSPAELQKWLATPESRSVGWKGGDGKARESVGHDDALDRTVTPIDFDRARAQIDNDRLSVRHARSSFVASTNSVVAEYLVSSR